MEKSTKKPLSLYKDYKDRADSAPIPWIIYKACAEDLQRTLSIHPPLTHNIKVSDQKLRIWISEASELITPEDELQALTIQLLEDEFGFTMPQPVEEPEQEEYDTQEWPVEDATDRQRKLYDEMDKAEGYVDEEDRKQSNKFIRQSEYDFTDVVNRGSDPVEDEEPKRKLTRRVKEVDQVEETPTKEPPWIPKPGERVEIIDGVPRKPLTREQRKERGMSSGKWVSSPGGGGLLGEE